MDPSISSSQCEEENEGEADAVIEIVKSLVQEGNKPSDLAVITPFRKQVRLIRSKAHDALEDEKLPLIDTVERMQGQDVKCIILTFASSSRKYIKSIEGFLFNHNRLNVMISRAKTKIIIFGSDIVQADLKSILHE